jgi:hypothetical protein
MENRLQIKSSLGIPDTKSETADGEGFANLCLKELIRLLARQTARSQLADGLDDTREEPSPDHTKTNSGEDYE